MKRSFAPLTIALFAVALHPTFVCAEDNAIFKDLVKQGVPLSNGKTVKLSDPVMVDGLDEANQLKVLTGLTDSSRLDSFLKGGISDWFELKKTAIRGARAQDSIGRQIDLYFVAQGKLEMASSQDFTKKLLNQNDQNARSRAEFFTDDELESPETDCDQHREPERTICPCV